MPRHLFVPGVRPEGVYADEAVVVARDDGLPAAPTNQPSTTAAVLEQLAVAPGDRVLEIGTGTGYEAALLAELTGPTGAVSTVDIDPVLAARAGERLSAAGYRWVETAGVDGWHGVPANAPFDRMLCSVGVWDISPAWYDQLDTFGVLVLPLWLRAGLQISVALRWDLDRLVSTGVLPCGSDRLRGLGAGPEGYLSVHGRSVCLDGGGPDAVQALDRMLGMPASVLSLPAPLRPGWFTSLALAAPDAIQMAWLDPVRGYVTASGVFDADRGGLALVVPGRGAAELHVHGDSGAAERLRMLLEVRPVRVSDLRIDLLFGGERVLASDEPLAVLRRPNATVLVRRVREFGSV